MLIVCGEEEDKVCGLEVGVDDYVIKFFLLKELMVCIKVVICCVLFILLEEVIEVYGLCFDLILYCVILEGSELDMGLIEFRLLYFFMIYFECVYSCE